MSDGLASRFRGIDNITTFGFVVWLFSGALATLIEAFWTTVATTSGVTAPPAAGECIALHDPYLMKAFCVC